MINAILGTMHSGKTRKLIQFHNTLQDISNVYVLKPKIDKKGDNFVVSGNDKLECDFLIDSIEKFKSFIFGIPSFDSTSILIDEAQFLDVEYLDFMFDLSGINFYLFGLVSNSGGIMWPIMEELLSNRKYEDCNFYYTKCLCEENGNKVAIFNKKISSNKSEAIIDIENDNVKYKAVCGSMFNE